MALPGLRGVIGLVLASLGLGESDERPGRGTAVRRASQRWRPILMATGNELATCAPDWCRYAARDYAVGAVPHSLVSAVKALIVQSV